MNKNQALECSRRICQALIMTILLFGGLFCFHNLSVQAAETDAPEIEELSVNENGKEGLEQLVSVEICIGNYNDKYSYEYRVVGSDTWKELKVYGVLQTYIEKLRYGDRVEVRAKAGDTYTRSGYFKVLTDEVLNGNFEVTGRGTSLKVGEDIYGWRTTNSEGKIDISSNASAYGLKGARRGKNFAVLDASKDGALYQEIKVKPGQELRWTLSNTACGGTGRMMVIVGPALSASESYSDKNASGLNFFEDLRKQIGNRTGNTTKSEKGKKYEIVTRDGEKGSWTDRSYIDYEVPEGEYELVFAVLPVESESQEEVSVSAIDDIEFGKGAELKIGYFVGVNGNITIAFDKVSEDKEGTVYAVLDKDGKIVHNWTGAEERDEEDRVEWLDLSLDRAPYTILKSLDKKNSPNRTIHKQVAVVNVTRYMGEHVEWSSYKDFAYGKEYKEVKDLTNCRYGSSLEYLKPANGYSWNGKTPKVVDENGNIQKVEVVDKEQEIYSIMYRVPDTSGSMRIAEEPTLNMKVNGIKENGSFKGTTSFSIEGVTYQDEVTVEVNGTKLEKRGDNKYTLRPSANAYTVKVTDEYGNTLEIKNVKVDWLGEIEVPKIESKTYNGEDQAGDIESGQIDGINYWVTGDGKAIDAGTYHATLTLDNPEYRWKETENVKISEDGVEAEVPFIIKKAVPELTLPKGQSLLENGKAQELIVPGKSDDGTFMYRLSCKDWSGEWQWEGDWSEKIPKAPKMYWDPVCRIYYKFVGDKNHEDIGESDENFVETSVRVFEVEWYKGCGNRYFSVRTSDLSKIKVLVNGKEVEGDEDDHYRGKCYTLVPNKGGYSIWISDGYGHEKDEFVMVDWYRVRPPVSASKVYTGSNLKSDLTDGVIEERAEGMGLAYAEYEVIKNDGGTDAGTYDVVLRLKDTVNYQWYVDADSDIKLNEDRTEATVPFTITKATPEITTIPAAKKLTCTGKSQELVTQGVTTGGTLEYSLDGEDWSTEIPKAVDVGEYTVYYRVNGGKNYEDIEADTVTVTIEKKKETKPQQDNPKKNTEQQDNTKKNTAQGDIYLNAGLKVTPVGKKLNIKWGKVPGAAGYDVYVQYCGKKYTANSLYEVKNGKTTKLVVKKINKKKLDLKKEYRIYVEAYRREKGKKVVLAKTITAHVVGRLHKKATNVKEIKLNKISYNMKKGTKQTIRAKAVLMNKKKKQLSNRHAREFRFASGNPKVASVSSSGIIKAVGKGSCTVYVYARNGYTKAIKVTVK